jgi:hypothetical protein
VVFYGIALAFIAVHFWPHGQSAVAEVPPLEGWTSQGRAIDLRVGRHGVMALDMTFRTECGGGRVWFPRWWPADNAPVHFHNRGHDFSVREHPGGVEAWMTGTTSSDRRAAHGIARYTEDVGGGRVCDSGTIAWTVRRR